jgi:hypothetical protein
MIISVNTNEANPESYKRAINIRHIEQVRPWNDGKGLCTDLTEIKLCDGESIVATDHMDEILFRISVAFKLENPTLSNYELRECLLLSPEDSKED